MTGEQRQPTRGLSRPWPFRSRDDIVTVVDLGAQKVACAIACLAEPRFGLNVGARNIRILGSATVRSSGLFGGRITNLAAAETCVRRAVAQAENQARLTVEDVVVTGQFHGLTAEVFEARLPTRQSVLLKEDIDAISAAAGDYCKAAKRKLLHIFTAASESATESISGAGNLPETTDVIALSMPLYVAREVEACFAKSLLGVRGYIAGPIATALSVSNAIERLAGVLVLDMGAQSTGYVLFSQGLPLTAGCVSSGGQHVTEELARTFALRKFEAERLKTHYGSIYDNLQADVDLPATNGETHQPISKFTLNHLIRTHVSSTLRAVNERLKGAGYPGPIGGVVLSGGGSLLPGVGELASQVFATEARMAAPIALNGLNAEASQSALVGGCLYASRHQSPGEMPYARGLAAQDSSYASRISQWLRASF